MPQLRPPTPPGTGASDEQVAMYQNALRDYRVAVQNVASEIEVLCRDIFNMCEQLGNAPMSVMDSISTNIWQGRAAMEFQFEGGTRKQRILDAADEYREMTTVVMKATNAKLSSL